MSAMAHESFRLDRGGLVNLVRPRHKTLTVLVAHFPPWTFLSHLVQLCTAAQSPFLVGTKVPFPFILLHRVEGNLECWPPVTCAGSRCQNMICDLLSGSRSRGIARRLIRTRSMATTGASLIRNHIDLHSHHSHHFHQFVFHTHRV